MKGIGQALEAPLGLISGSEIHIVRPLVAPLGQISGSEIHIVRPPELRSARLPARRYTSLAGIPFYPIYISEHGSETHPCLSRARILCSPTISTNTDPEV